MPEIARMAASLVACLARPNGAPHFLPYAPQEVPLGDERFRAFACAFHAQTDPKQAPTHRRFRAVPAVGGTPRRNWRAAPLRCVISRFHGTTSGDACEPSPA
ncbi:hypothetical protein D7207_05660 [Burkholderia cepacia]|nr:hypothetical protein [Burkholderia cepacia]MBA9944775.1 hypothetical protein [Burkholderia cepacia]MBA9973529.1 hypothetical protein [Burkholderia cepacia]MBA9993111.1 hypothetical protein [Burkholderia cepacia]MBB0000102.1 hypothetical protein [Burkholderia cepacia]